MTDRELMQMARDALESWQKTCLDCGRSSEELGRSTKPLHALRAALAQTEKIECSRSHPHENMGSHCQLRTEIARLTNENARLKAQPETDPVVYRTDKGATAYCSAEFARKMGWHAVSAPQREWVGLTDEEVEACWNSLIATEDFSRITVYQIIQAKLKEKNGY